jgi:hypothetical protein
MVATQPSSLELLWSQALDVAPPWRIAAFMILCVLVIGRVLPWLVRALGRLAAVAAEPVAGALLLPEYLLSNWRRERGRPPLPGTYLYDMALERGADGVRKAAVVLARTVGKSRRIPWRRILLAALLPALLWYGNLYLPRSQPLRPVVDLLENVQRPLLATDTWIAEHGGVAPYKAPTKPVEATCEPKKPAAKRKKRT